MESPLSDSTVDSSLSLQAATYASPRSKCPRYGYLSPKLHLWPASRECADNMKLCQTDPLWFYCRQTGHCAQGMVFAVNAPTTGNHTFQDFLANALGSDVTNTMTTTATLPPSTTTTTSSSLLTVTTPPPSVSVVTVTQTITLGNSTWTTTYGSYPGSPNPTPNETPVVHTIKVGENGALTFNPPNITAQPRDIVMFGTFLEHAVLSRTLIICPEFLAKNHTATQSSFANPCRPLGDTTSTTGFDSGFEPVTQGDLIPQLFNITVSDTAPIWVRHIRPCPHLCTFRSSLWMLRFTASKQIRRRTVAKAWFSA
jgi:hypothetical protein